MVLTGCCPSFAKLSPWAGECNQILTFAFLHGNFATLLLISYCWISWLPVCLDLTQKREGTSCHHAPRGPVGRDVNGLADPCTRQWWKQGNKESQDLMFWVLIYSSLVLKLLWILLEAKSRLHHQTSVASHQGIPAGIFLQRHSNELASKHHLAYKHQMQTNTGVARKLYRILQICNVSKKFWVKPRENN